MLQLRLKREKATRYRSRLVLAEGEMMFGDLYETRHDFQLFDVDGSERSGRVGGAAL